MKKTVGLLFFVIGVFSLFGGIITEATQLQSNVFPQYNQLGLSYNEVIKQLNDTHYEKTSLFDNVNINGNTNLVIDDLAYFLYGVSINGNASLEINGDAYFNGVLQTNQGSNNSSNTQNNSNSNGNNGDFFSKEIIKVTGDAYIHETVNMSGNRKMTVDGDLYIYGNPNFVFNGNASMICVKGDLYYTDQKPEYYTSACGSEGKGLYVENAIKQGEVGLKFHIEPSQSSYTMDSENNYVDVDVTATVQPFGESVETGNRQTPIDVVFLFDTSGSMELDMSCYDKKKKLNKCKDKQKLKSAQEAAKNALDIFKESAVQGDRFAFIPFSLDVKNVTSFNTDTSIIGIEQHINNIEESIDKLDANGGTDYYAAFSKANELFANSTNPKYIIFLTDGRPDTYGDYSKITLTGEFQKEICTSSWWFSCTKKEWSTEKYSLNNIDTYLYEKNGNIVFNYNNDTYLYKKGYGDIDYGYAYYGASSLASKGVNILSIGFGSDGDVDMEFLNELSSLTGFYAQKGEKNDISSIFEDISTTINQQALRDIKVKMNIKDPNFYDHVSLQEGAIVDHSDPNYVVVNFEDIQLEKGKTPEVPIPKTFSLRITEPGQYQFNEIFLTYTNIDNETVTVPGDAFTIHVADNKSIGMTFRSNEYEINVDSNPAPVLDLLSTNQVIPDKEGAELPEVIQWSSTNEKVATVQNGIVTPHSNGETLIKITAFDEQDNPIEATTKVIVNLVIEDIEFTKENYLYEEMNDVDLFPLVNIIHAAPPSFTLDRNAILWSTEGNIFRWKTNMNGQPNGILTKVKDDSFGFQLVTAELKANPSENYYYKIKDGTDIKINTFIKVNNNEENKIKLRGEDW